LGTENWEIMDTENSRKDGKIPHPPKLVEENGAHIALS
jgi:hypothetical protein